MKHNPETYVQFASLLLKPPTTSKDVPTVIDKLQEKKVIILHKIRLKFSIHSTREIGQNWQIEQKGTNLKIKEEKKWIDKIENCTK